MKLTLTKHQNEKLHLLRLEGLRREIELHEAVEAYEKAQEIEKAVSQYVVDNNDYRISELDYDIEEIKNGDRITDEFDLCLIDEKIFEEDVLPKVKDAYMTLYGIDNPLNFVYSYPMFKRKMDAERAYKMMAVSFLKTCGKIEESKYLENAINGYLSPEIEERLYELIKNFIEGRL